jgi:hypothetical protein
MKTKPNTTALLATLLTACLLATTATAQTQYIGPSIDKNGNYRDGYYRSSPNANRYDNLNAESNGYNPYSGKKARDKDEYSAPPTYNRSNPAYTLEYDSGERKSRSNCIRDLFTNECI